MTAEIISVGTELLLGEIVDRDAVHAAQVLASLGVNCYHRQTVGDNRVRLQQAVSLALSRADFVLVIGGLGPTLDDLTRDGVADALGLDVESDSEYEATLRHQFEARGLPWSENQLTQVKKPRGSQWIENKNGTARGIWWSDGTKSVACLPGPPNEFGPMMDGFVAEKLAQQSGSERLYKKVYSLIGIGEARAEELIGPLMTGSDVTVAPYAKLGFVNLRLATRASSQEEAESKWASVALELEAILGKYVFSISEEPLEQVIVQSLVRQNATLSVAESCTGGWLGQRITSVDGSSAVFNGGVISYSNELKMALLGVSADTLQTHGAVSEECACEMASGARQRMNSTFALSVTGIAGSGGGTNEKPVGLVYIGLATPEGTTAKRHLFIGNRETIRIRSTTAALGLLWVASKSDS